MGKFQDFLLERRHTTFSCLQLRSQHITEINDISPKHNGGHTHSRGMTTTVYQLLTQALFYIQKEKKNISKIWFYIPYSRVY